jgi:valyl-tRNA synthetase
MAGAQSAPVRFGLEKRGGTAKASAFVLEDEGCFYCRPESQRTGVSEQEGAMSVYELSTTYDFKATEERLYRWWSEQGYFRPREDGGSSPYVISMPPPNITGELHLGHAMFVAMEDLMIRHQRMKGRPALWVPGSDHAGIATQLQVEKYLQRTQNVTREQIGRQEFEDQTWAWKRKYGGIITDQLRRLGASCDWERERFTLDEGMSRAVREAFVRFHEKGLIYRGTYLVNWSPGLRTAVSDLEVEYSEEQGTLYYFDYPLDGEDQSIPVATTRPETILGDTAVAVHPDDTRFSHLVGKHCRVPILGRLIPVIADDYVDIHFGTGALKITPGHDAADYEIGKRHDLPVINVLNADATMNENAGPYAGLDRIECRTKLWSDMQAAGLTIKTEPYLMQVPRSQRGGEIIEPMISTQWFVKMKPLAEPALEAVRQGRIEVVPERFAKVYFNWLENIRDWCISRQLWWGHRIPAWYCQECGALLVARQDPTACDKCGSQRLEQDPDVLDTWFSSGLWPFSTLGWPEGGPDYERFYPTTMMETGYDILFFWVARMIMMGLEFTGQPPFGTVYLHGLVRDASGRKMSKTLGNVIDPLQVMDEFGADALRFTMLTGSSPGNDMNLSLERVEANRNFANKLWNATRLVLRAVEQADQPGGPGDELSLADRWIEARRRQITCEVNRLFDSYQFGEAGRQVYDFFWGEFADWYLEIAKIQLAPGGGQAWQTARIMAGVLDTCLRLLHPFTPFVTEELWGKLRAACLARDSGIQPAGGWPPALIIAAWPKPEPEAPTDGGEIQAFHLVMELVRAVRNMRAARNVPPGKRIALQIHAGDKHGLLNEQAGIVAALAGIDASQLEVKAAGAPPARAIPLVVEGIEAYLPVAGMLDLAAERRRLSAELAETARHIERLESLLAGEFAQRAPGEVVDKERAKLEGLRQSQGSLKNQLEALGD